MVSGRTVDAGEKVAEGIRTAGGEAIFVKADVSVTADVQRLVEETVSAYGKLDVLFNNAGIGTTGLTADESEESWDRCMTVNLKSVFLGIKYAVPEMIKNGGGSIVSNSSMWGITASHPVRGLVCRFQGGDHRAHQEGGPGLCATEGSGQLHLPRRHRVRRAG